MLELREAMAVVVAVAVGGARGRSAVIVALIPLSFPPFLKQIG